MEQKTAEIYSMFQPVEGFNQVYYGKVRNGKTYAATRDILELLQRGEVVYANWKVNFDGYDERNNFWVALIKLIVGKEYFYDYKGSNFHYIDTNNPNLIQDLNRLVGVHLFIDEGQWIFNSHLKTDDPDKRRLVLEGGHYCRSLNVITQRPSNILKDIRSQVHIWFKCEKVFSLGKLIRFVRYEIQDMKDDLPDEEMVTSTRAYWGRSRYYNAYNTHAFRREDAVIKPPEFDVYKTTLFDRVVLVVSFLTPKWPRRVLARALARKSQAVAVNPTEVKEKKRWFLRDVKGTKVDR